MKREIDWPSVMAVVDGAEDEGLRPMERRMVARRLESRLGGFGVNAKTLKPGQLTHRMVGNRIGMKQDAVTKMYERLGEAVELCVV